MAYTAAGSGAGASPPAVPAGQSTPAPAPAMTVNFDKTVTALINRTIIDNLRASARWLVPGAYIEANLIRGTNLVRFIAYGDLPSQLSLIAVEGVPPAEEALTIGSTEFTVQQRGRLMGVTDVALAMSPHELMSIAAEKVAYDALMTVDRSIAAAVAAGTGITLAQAGSALTAADVRKWAAIMKVNNIPPFGDGYYVAMVNPAIVYDLMTDTGIGGWIESSKYADPSRLLTGEIGRMYGVRFVESTIGTSVAGSPDTYTTVVFGPDYFAFGDLQSVETYMVRPGGDHSDPLAQKALVGYKGMWGAKTIEMATAGGPRFGIVRTQAGTDLTA